MKIKKIVSILLVMVVILGSFAGCSYEELGYLKMQINVANMEKVRVKGETEIELTFTDTMNNLESELMNTLNSSIAAATEKLSDFPIDKVSIRLEAVKDANNNYLEYTAKFTLTGDHTTIGTFDMNFVMKNGNIYMSRKSLVEILDTVVRIVDKYLGQKLTKEDLVEIGKIKKHIGTEGYVEIYNIQNQSQMYSNPAAFNMQMYNIENAKDINKIAVDFLKNTFNELDTKLVYKEEDGSYTLYLDNEIVQKLILDIVEYISNNKEKVFDEYIKLLRGINEYVNFKETYQIDVEQLIMMLEQEKEEIFAYMDIALENFGKEEKAMLADTMNRFDGTYYIDNIKKITSSDYEYKQDMEVYLYNLKMLNVYSEYKYSKIFSDIKEKEVENTVTLEELIYSVE